jgi:hypothetical protein
VVSEIEALLDKAKQLKRIDEASMNCLTAITTSLDKALDDAKERVALIDYIPSLKKHFSTNCFDDTTEDQLCDMVWAYQSLDNYRASADSDDECLPSLCKMLHVLERKAQESDDRDFAERWTKADFDRFWRQQVSGHYYKAGRTTP